MLIAGIVSPSGIRSTGSKGWLVWTLSSIYPLSHHGWIKEMGLVKEGFPLPPPNKLVPTPNVSSLIFYSLFCLFHSVFLNFILFLTFFFFQFLFLLSRSFISFIFLKCWYVEIVFTVQIKLRRVESATVLIP